MKLRVMLAVVAFLIVGSLEVSAQDGTTVTNGLTQIAEELCQDDSALFYIPDGVGWWVYVTDYWQPKWIDFAAYPSLEKLRASATQAENQCVLGSPLYGVQPVHVTLTFDLLSGNLVLRAGCSADELETTAPPKDYQPGKWPTGRIVERMWQNWLSIQKDPDWQEWYGKDAKPFLTFNLQLADLNEKEIYAENLAAEEAAWEEWEKSGGDTLKDSGAGGGMSMMMVDNTTCNGCPVIETNDFRVCDITYNSSNATAIVTWESCNTHFYDMYSTQELSTNTSWNFRTNLVGQVSFTAWTDYDDLSVLTARFYRVTRLALSGDPDNDGLSNAQELQYGTNPHNRDTDGDGIWDGPFGTNVVGAAGYSLSGVPDAFPNDPSRYLNVDSDPFTNITVAMFKTVNIQTNFPNPDSNTEIFDVSSRGRFLPYAPGSSASAGFGRISGGIYFNHDATNLYIGVAGLDQGSGNALLLFLDTDGSNGGITNLSQMVTNNTPYGITRSRNLSFGTNFTPNVGIIVGDKFGDGQNFDHFEIPSGSTDFGQGVYGLSPTVATNFYPGFTTTGAKISQWGDANNYAANGGIEIAISKSALGLTNGAIFRAAAIIAGSGCSGGCPGTNSARYFSYEAYGESVSGNVCTADGGSNFACNAVSLVGAQVYLSTNPPPAYAPFTGVTDNSVMMQGFYWNVPRTTGATGDWYNVIQAKTIELATNGFTLVWMPPPQKSDYEDGSNLSASVGYDPYDHYDLGEFFKTGSSASSNTLYGSRSELETALAALRNTGVTPCVDIVMNHIAGGNGVYTNLASGHFLKVTNDFYTTPFEQACDPFHRQVGVNFGDEVNQNYPHMRYGLEAWGTWLTAVVGFQGYRFDVAHSIEPWYLAEWLAQPATSNRFAVLEHNNGASAREIQSFIQLVDQRASAFDFPLHDNYLVPMCGTGSFNMASLYHAGLAGVMPSNAVTFVENHDTSRPCEGNDNPRKVGIQQDKLLAYAYVLISEGLPCVFYHDYYELPNAVLVTNQSGQCFGNPNDAFTGPSIRPQIDRLIRARQLYVAGTTTFISDGNSTNVYVARRTGDGPFNKSGCVLAINRISTNITVTVNTGFNSTNLVDRVDTNGSPFNVTTTSSGTATFAVPGRSYRVLAP